MRRKLLVSLGFIQAVLLMLGVLVIGFIWTLHFHHQALSRAEAVESKAEEHLNLAIIVAENLRQLIDRAKAIGRVIGTEGDVTPSERWSLSRVLAEDPVFNRLSIYAADGTLMFSSHSQNLPRLPVPWLAEVAKRTDRFGFKPFFPVSFSAGERQGLFPNWRMPLLLPLVDRSQQGLDRIVLIDMDIGYLASLYQHIELGRTGLIQVLDASGKERLRADGSGVIFGGPPLIADGASMPDTPAGRYVSVSAGNIYQSLYSHLPEHAVSVVVSQQQHEILSPLQARQSRQLWLNLTMTGVILASVFWMIYMLGRQQVSLDALQKAQLENQGLIARLEEEHERSSHAASTDHLSGLFNRRQFIEVATRGLKLQRSRRRLLAILFIDLDRFKTINDTLGHKTGDLLLQAVAGRIRRMLEPGDQAARFGGDEFVVMLAGDRSEQQITAWVDTLAERLCATYSLEGRELNTSPSIGIAICPRDAQDIDELIRCADAAMYSAKQAGRGQYRFFDPSLNLTNIEAFHIEQALGEALKKHQFILHYQPQIRLDSMSIVGYEALVRWQHPEFGLLYPDRFIEIAERSGFIVPMGLEILQMACRQLAQWRDQGIATCLSVNVSALQLHQPDFSNLVLAELERFDLDPRMLDLEITETAILDREGLSIAHLETLKAAGIGISLDDFGKGYAGFAHLQSLPVSKLKIDRSLIAQLTNSHDDSLIVSSTITLAQRLSLQVVAEGVETREQVVCLKLAGCDIAQGYHFSRPVPPEQLADLDPSFRVAAVSN